MAEKAKVYADSQGNMFIKPSGLFKSEEFKRTMEKLNRISPLEKKKKAKE
ncbi:MAG: hypothetical protein WBB45_07435 [Cyclobacteriaceae bacterium]